MKKIVFSVAVFAVLGLTACVAFLASEKNQAITPKCGIRCSFCKGTGFNGMFNCTYCKGSGRNNSY